MRNNSYRLLQMANAAICAMVLLFLFYVFTITTGPAAAYQMVGVSPQSLNAAPPPGVCAEDESAVEPEFQPLDVPLDAELQHEIYLMCEEVGVPFEVEMGLIERESGFDPNAVSRTDDHGLAQINRCNFAWLQKELGSLDFYNPIQNVRASLHILGPLWEKYGPHRALMAYQSGETGARRRWTDGQTDSPYSRDVLARAAAFGWVNTT